VAGDDASRLIIAVDQLQGAEAAMAITGAVLAACWSQERNIADPKVLAELVSEQRLDPACLDKANSQAVQVAYEQYTEQAIAAGVFGAPSYVVEGEIFWGQDRLDFLDRRLA
jgi:carboxymethylenebutenolidase